MSIQTARENAVLDALFAKTGTAGTVMAVLDGNGMPASPVGVADTLSSLVRRGLVSRSGAAYRITAAGQAAVRQRKAGSAAAPASPRLTASPGSAASSRPAVSPWLGRIATAPRGTPVRSGRPGGRCYR
jgi:DNA-binding IclR family transcriptional regulator